MKKIITVALIGSIIFACSRKTITTSETKNKDKGTQSASFPNVPPPGVNVPTGNPSPPAGPPETAPSSTETLAAGKAVYTAKCGRCHGLKEVSAYTEQAWGPLLKSMIPKARLNEEEAAHVTAYVTANAKK